MPDSLRDRYSIYPKEKKKKKVLLRDDHFLKRSFEWLKWKLVRVGNFDFYKPCLKG